MSIVAFVFCIILGVLFFVVGVIYLSGRDKAVHFDSFSTAYAAKMGIPLGVFFSCFGLFFLFGFFPQQNEIIKTLEMLVLYIGLSAMILGNFFMLLPVRNCPLYPKWVKWLEIEHRDILGLLHYEANLLGLSEWAHLVKGKDGLEQWVEKVREKYSHNGAK